MSVAIELPYGASQRFRRRYRELTVVGSFLGALPVREAIWRLADGEERPFYVESVSGEGVDYSYQYKPSPARLRLPHAGDFTVEVPIDEPALRQAGRHELRIRIVGADGATAERSLELDWDPRPVPLPLDLSDLSNARSIQEIGQVVDGRWDVDPTLGVIRTRAPAAPDSLVLLGSPGASQEATYEWRYLDAARSKYVGFSDFFVGHEFEDPAIPVKPGWSTAGLATSRPRGEGEWEARIWIARGDRPGWRPTSATTEQRRIAPRVVRTEPAAMLPLRARQWYRVRHQVRFDERAVSARFRVWPADAPEPADWLCDETYRPPDSDEGGFDAATFGLFQHSGLPSEWREIRLDALG